jgi:tetrathionate reductase subunit A
MNPREPLELRHHSTMPMTSRSELPAPARSLAITASRPGISRRQFMRAAGRLAAATAALPAFFRLNPARAAQFGNPVLVSGDPRVEIKYSVCQGCHGRCGLKAKVVDGVLVKLEGNPYHPCNLEAYLPFATDPSVARALAGRMCAKGLGGLQSLYDPHRLRQPLKRVGERGAGQWQAISWEQAFSEIAAKLVQYRDLNTPMDPEAPDLGPKVNQIVFSGGRNQQSAFTDVFFKNIIGTVNSRHDHTSICETSHHIAHELTTGWGDAAPFLTSGYKNHSKPDLPNAEVVLWFGTDPCAANFTFVAIARKFIEMARRGGKIYVVDPRCNVAASKATWVPIKPGTDAALALALGRHLVDQRLYNEAFLRRPHEGAANPTGELNVTDATLLVKLVEGRPAAFLRASEAGIEGGKDTDFVVWAGGAARKFDTVDEAELLPGALTVNGLSCKTAFQLYVERVRERTLAEWSEICGVPVALIQQIGNDLAAAGRRGSATMYRGAVQHTNGTYTGMAILALNTLLGNYNWKGGLSFGGGGWSTGSAQNTVPGGVKESGTQITRVKARYESSSEYARKVAAGQNPYPAKRPWFPLAGHYNYQELFPSIEDEYPYPVKALILYWNGMPYSTPAARATFERVMSAKVNGEYKLPLVVAIDIAMGEATAWADYVLPDTTYLERWTVVGLTPTTITKASPVRQPVVGTVDPLTGDYTGVLPNTKTLEDILIGLGHAMHALDPSVPKPPWRNAWAYWSQAIKYLAETENGPGVEAVLARGGRFEDADQAYEGDRLRRRFSGRIYFFSEKLATKRDSMTGRWLDGLAHYEPAADALDRPLDSVDGAYPLHLITYKMSWHSQMHTIRYPWLVAVQPENFVEMHPTDARARGLRTGDRCRLTSASRPEGVVGRVRVTETVRPGVVAVSHHFGHWEMSSRPATIDGHVTAHDPSRGRGINANLVMRADPALPNVTLQDKVGGSASFYDTRVQVEAL